MLLESKKFAVLGRRMAYVERGAGHPDYGPPGIRDITQGHVI
jgi:hypothetical protein